jgi:hypothetical protein
VSNDRLMTSGSLKLRNPSHCRCGHVAEAHEHYRAGRDCGACDCRRFTTADSRSTAGLAAVLLAVLFG